MQLQLVAEAQESCMDFPLGDLGDGTVVFAAVMIPAPPIGDPPVGFFSKHCTARAAVDLLSQRVIGSFSCGNFFCPKFQQLFGGIEYLSVDDGRMAGGTIILIPLPKIALFLMGKRIRGLLFLEERVPDVSLIAKHI